MRSWFLLLGGLLVWTVHFFGLYAIAEVVGATATGRGVVLGLTGLCVAADVLILLRAIRIGVVDGFSRWLRSVAMLGAALSLVAVAWQALPALWL